MVECGGLENRFTRNPGNEGSNPSSSAIYIETLASPGVFLFAEDVRDVFSDLNGISQSAKRF